MLSTEKGELRIEKKFKVSNGLLLVWSSSMQFHPAFWPVYRDYATVLRPPRTAQRVTQLH
jgi:hypothetical protein